MGAASSPTATSSSWSAACPCTPKSPCTAAAASSCTAAASSCTAAASSYTAAASSCATAASSCATAAGSCATTTECGWSTATAVAKSSQGAAIEKAQTGGKSQWEGLEGEQIQKGGYWEGRDPGGD